MSTVPQTIDPPKKPKACSVIPTSTPITIPMPFGIDVKAITDMSKGPPNDCAIVHSMMLQLMPMLSGFACVLKVLNVISALEETLKATPPLATGIPKVLSAISDLKNCIPPLSAPAWLEMIKAILQLILSFLGCLIQAFESIRNFKIGVDLNAEGGTPLLLNTLDCAKGNGDTSLASLLSAMGPIEPLLTFLSPIAKLVGIDLSGISLGGSSGSDPLQPVIDFHDKLAEIVNSIP
jgi:hypothetical protein